MGDLSQDILLEIASYFRSQIDVESAQSLKSKTAKENKQSQAQLFTLTLVNRAISKAATTILYHSVDLRDYKNPLHAFMTFTQTLAKQPELAKLVRRIHHPSTFYEGNTPDTLMFTRKEWEPGPAPLYYLDPDLSTALRRLSPAVQRLPLQPKTKKRLIRRLHVGLPDAMFALCVALCINVQMLELEVPKAPSITQFMLLVLRDLPLASLEEVQLTGESVLYEAAGTDAALLFLEKASLTAFTANSIGIWTRGQETGIDAMTSKLRKLRLYNCHIEVLDWEAFKFPHLQTFHLLQDRELDTLGAAPSYRNMGDWIRDHPSLEHVVIQLQALYPISAHDKMGSLAETSLLSLEVSVLTLFSEYELRMVDDLSLRSMLPETLMVLDAKHMRQKFKSKTRMNKGFITIDKNFVIDRIEAGGIRWRRKDA